MPAPSVVKVKGRPTGLPPGMGPDQIFQLFTGLPIPDIITFVISPDYLDRGTIMYPRQATLLKIIFLRDDLFTDYDNAVIDEWEQSFRETGNNGIVPGVRDRIRWLKDKGHKWFRETLLVMGRRAGKGHISGLSMSYVLWHYMAKGDPQAYYGVDRDKKLVSMVFAGKRDQAKATVWQDAVNYITGSTCFLPYIRTPLQAEKLSVYAPHDFVRMRRLAQQGVNPNDINLATFELVPKESTLMAGRGPTSFSQAWDEMAHVVASGANRSAEEVYAAAKPSLDQFGKDAFIIAPSSPWQMLGQFYVNYCNSLLMDETTGLPVYPEMLMIQLASWDIYKDWEIAHEIPIFPEGYMGDLGEYEGQPRPYFKPLRGAIQAYDELMAREEQANPDTFKVERRSHFAVALDAYLNEAKVKTIFQPWPERNPHFGGPLLGMQERGRLDLDYKAHGDPSKSNANFGLAVAHAEPGPDGRLHVVFDKIHHFEPQNFEGHIVDYDEIEEWIWDNMLAPFMPTEMTFDQFNSAQVIQRLAKRSRKAALPKVTSVYEKTATKQHNWKRAEIFKTAVYMGWVHCFAGETRYMTPEGIKTLQETAGTDQRVLDQSGEWVDAEIRSFGVQPLKKVTLRRNQVEKVLYATNGHRWVTVPAGRKYRSAALDGKIKTTAELTPGTRLAWMKPRSRLGKLSPSPIGVMHGMVFGDGYATRSGSRVTLWGEKDLQLLRYFSDQLPRVPCETPGGVKGVRINGLPRYYKAPPPMDEAPAYLYGWLAGYLAADGTVGASGQVILSSVNRENIELVKRVCDRLGLAYGSVSTKQMRSDFAASEECFELTLCRETLRDDLFLIEEHRQRFLENPVARSRMGWTVISVEETDRVEEVYCAVVPSTATFTLEDHLLTGNCPYYEQAELELRFLQEKNGVVDHPDSGPVQTKDVADAMMECVMALIGDQIVSMRSELGSMRPQGTLQGGVEPFPGMSSNQELFGPKRTQEQVFQQLGGLGKARGMRPDSPRMSPRTRGRKY